jgi:hypothetical protein
VVRALVGVVLRTLGADHVVQAGGNVALPLLVGPMRPLSISRRDSQ